MKNIKYLFLALLCTVAIQSCYKDKGNYDYIDLDKVEIDTSNLDIKSQYSIYRYDNLSISPKIYYNDELITTKEQAKGKLAFTWSIFQATSGSNIYSRDTISDEPSLNQAIVKQAGNWILHLAVKDLKTNVETYQRFGLNINESSSAGWMVLYERDGNTDLALIVDDRVKNGATQSRVLMDLIKNSNEKSLEGKPINMFHSQIPTGNGYIFIASEKDYVGIANENFLILNPFENNFFAGAVPTVKAPGYTQANFQRTEVLINNNKVHTQNLMTSGSDRNNSFYSIPLAGEYGQLANWLPVSLGASFNAIVYDSTNKRFLQSTTATNRLSPFVAQLGTTQFDVNNVGLDLIAADWGKGINPALYYEYLLMSNSTNKYLLIANFNVPNAVGLNKYDITNLPDINNATTVAAALNGSFIYYASGNKLYRYLYGNTPVVDLVWTAPAGESITRVEIQKTYITTLHVNNILPSMNELVHIATWNEADKNGKVYNIKSNQTSGDLDVASQRVYSGFGKIKDMKQKVEYN